MGNKKTLILVFAGSVLLAVLLAVGISFVQGARQPEGQLVETEAVEWGSATTKAATTDEAGMPPQTGPDVAATEAPATGGATTYGLDGTTALGDMEEQKVKDLKSAALSQMVTDGYDPSRYRVTVVGEPQESSEGTIVYLHVEGTDLYYTAQNKGSWQLYRLTEKVPGVNDGTGSGAAGNGTTNIPVADESALAKEMDQALARAIQQAWTNYVNANPGHDFTGAYLVLESFVQGDDPNVAATFKVYVPSDGSTRTGTVDAKSGIITIS